MIRILFFASMLILCFGITSPGQSNATYPRSFKYKPIYQGSVNDEVLHSLELRRLHFEKLGKEERERQLLKAKQGLVMTEELKEHYATFDHYPSVIPSASYEVFVVDNMGFFDVRQVVVENNKIVKYINGTGKATQIVYTAPIKNGKVKLKLSDDSDVFLDVYFLDFIERHDSLQKKFREIDSKY